jgi:uncharacterized membrane protein
MAEHLASNRRPLIAAATMLGIGLGGFLDGILFHQILQSHNMLSAPEYYPTTGIPPETQVVNLEVNMFWDGMFHAATWVATVLGIAMLWNACQWNDAPRSTKTLIGGLSLGWGLFNIVEGSINHHILHIHHVVESPDHLKWDLTFLASGVLLSIIGLVMIRRPSGPHIPDR